MGARVWHVQRATRNKDASDAFEAEWPDWCVVALFYSALHYVQSSLADEPELPRDERHPRKHSSPGGDDGRGTNQLVRDIYPEIHEQYRSLVELAHRTRYDVEKLGPMTIPMARQQWSDIKAFCETKNQGRAPLPARAV